IIFLRRGRFGIFLGIQKNCIHRIVNLHMKTAVWPFRNWLPLTGLARLTRLPNLVMIAIAQYLAAIFLIGEHVDWHQYLTDHRLFLLVTSTVLIAAAGYVINDYYDVKIDFINKPKRVVVGKV